VLIGLTIGLLVISFWVGNGVKTLQRLGATCYSLGDMQGLVYQAL